MMLLSQRAAAIKPSSHYQSLSLEDMLKFADAVTALPAQAGIDDLPKLWRDLIINGEDELRQQGRLRTFG